MPQNQAFYESTSFTKFALETRNLGKTIFCRDFGLFLKMVKLHIRGKVEFLDLATRRPVNNNT